MSLSPTDSDKKVLRAFADRKPASNNRIESTGDRLNTIGFAGSGCIARWSGDHIIDFGYESGGKFGPALIRALKKYTAPNDWAKKNRGYVTMRKNSQYSYKWFGIIRIGGKPKICLANEYKEDAMETRDDLGLPRGLVKIVSRNKIYEMGLKPSPRVPIGQDSMRLMRCGPLERTVLATPRARLLGAFGRDSQKDSLGAETRELHPSTSMSTSCKAITDTVGMILNFKTRRPLGFASLNS